MANSNRNNSGTNIEPSIVARISGALKYVFTGQGSDWFGPLAPLTPVAPPDVAGRQNDYPTGYNLNQKPRAYEPVSFEQMRGLADSLDVLRIVIEQRKDEICALDFIFKPKDEGIDHDPRCDELKQFFSFPDKYHTWSDWLRMILEDMFVIDAPTIYPRKTLGGQVYSFDPIDGATIKRVIDGGGRTPIAPAPAYQQILKGLPAVDYTRDELVYKPKNPRTNKVYGYSRVEQIIVTINIALRRQASQLSYYTDGSLPDFVFSVPKEWNTDQIATFQKYWDETLMGNLQNRRGTKFVPDGVNPINTKEQVLKDLYDEWLARIVCFAFGVSPTPFIKETNRATADTAMRAAREQGLMPDMNWIKDLMDMLIIRYFGYTDIVFSWEDKTEIEPKTQAEINKIYADAKILTKDEIRHDLGREPLTDKQKEELMPAPPPMVGDDPAAAEGVPPGKKNQPAPVTKARAMKKINRNRKLVVKNRNKLKKAILAALVKSRDATLAQLKKAATNDSFTKADSSDWEQLSFPALDDLYDDFETAAVNISTDGTAVAFAQVSYNNDDALNQANKDAIKWSKSRAAELVGKKYDSHGTLVDNPDARYRISDSTRDGIKALVTQAEEEGWSNDRLADELESSYQFSEQRADMIARTEAAFSDTNGNMIAYRESGVVMGKKWLLAPDSCDECQANADQGVIDLDDEFQDGSDCSPAHPHCVCDVMPVVGEDE